MAGLVWPEARWVAGWRRPRYASSARGRRPWG